MFRRILFTGPPLNGRDDYLEQVVEILNKRFNVKAKLYRVFDYMRKVGSNYGCPNLTRENIFDIPENILKNIRTEAFQLIDREINNEKDGVHIISSPNIFFISPHGHFASRETEGFDKYMLYTYIKPDYIVITIDDAINVKERLEKDQIWKDRVIPTLQTIVYWRNLSIEHIERLTKEIYESYGRSLRYLIFSVNHSPDVMADLILNNKPWIYLSYNMTGLPEEKFENVKRIYKKLRKYFVVFDPGTISEWRLVNEYDDAIEKGKETIITNVNGKTVRMKLSEVEGAIDLMRMQIVTRDYNLVEQSEAVFVYHHSEYPSYGVMAEVIRASQFAKPIYVLYPFNKRLSPFFEHYVKTSRLHVERIISLRNIRQPTGLEELENYAIRKMLIDICIKKFWPTLAQDKLKVFCREFQSEIEEFMGGAAAGL